MCGICGELRFDGASPDLNAVARMSERLRERGPDHGGHYSHGPLAFGHRRLSIIDLSDAANQPMVDAELGLVLVFNGAIYNYPALRRALQRRGHHFFSHGDTEVIVKAYAEWGEDCVRHFNGMFAFALWDERRQRLFLARDRLGIKPLYYTRDARRWRFASSPQALLAGGGVDTDVEPAALHHQLTLHAVIPAPATILKGVRKARPAHTITIEANGTMHEQRYWSLESRRPARTQSADEWQAAIRAALLQAVRRRREIADVPVGVLLSGGLDSSLLVGLLAEVGVTRLKTFTVGFDDHPEERGDEFEYSQTVADRFDTDHTRFHVPNAQLMERLPEAVRAMHEPMVGQDAVAFYLLSEQVSREVKVVQSGQGADEVFGGYFWYPQMDGDDGDELGRFASRYFDRDHQEWLMTIDPAYHSEDVTSSTVAAHFETAAADEFLDRVFNLDVTTLVVDDPVKRVDNMTMAWGLEARVPFLDHELVELAASMPKAYKLADGGKGVLKSIARGLLPEAVIDRPKAYFPVPALKFVRGTFLEQMRQILDSPACRERGLFRRDYVQRLLTEPEEHFTRLRGSKLWHLALLEWWLQLNVDGSG